MTLRWRSRQESRLTPGQARALENLISPFEVGTWQHVLFVGLSHQVGAKVAERQVHQLEQACDGHSRLMMYVDGELLGVPSAVVDAMRQIGMTVVPKRFVMSKKGPQT